MIYQEIKTYLNEYLKDPKGKMTLNIEGIAIVMDLPLSIRANFQRIESVEPNKRKGNKDCERAKQFLEWICEAMKAGNYDVSEFGYKKTYSRL